MGGAVFNHQGILTITTSTLAANSAASGTGGNPGQALGGAVFNLNGQVTMIGATLASNTVSLDNTSSNGGALFNLVRDLNTARTASVTRVSSILADSLGPAGVVDVMSFKSSALGTATVDVTDHNLVEFRSTLGSGGTITGTPLTADPRLGPLWHNGGPTQTMALSATSPALDKGVEGSQVSDQRGQPRRVDIPAVPDTIGDGTDLGAFERASLETTPPTCVWSVVSGTPKRIDFSVRDPMSDAGSGLASIVVTTAVNIFTPVAIPAFSVGTTSTVSFSAVKADQTQPSQVAVVLTDLNGNRSSCM